MPTSIGRIRLLLLSRFSKRHGAGYVDNVVKWLQNTDGVKVGHSGMPSKQHEAQEVVCCGYLRSLTVLPSLADHCDCYTDQ